jgi:hypothetical protein
VDTSGPLYVETSAVLRLLLEGDRQLSRELKRAPRLLSSILTFVECERGLRRALAAGRIDGRRYRAAQRWLSQFNRACDVAALNEQVTDYAKREFPVEPVRTLDALHLATIKFWDESIGASAVMSTDQRVRDNASAWGLTLLPE